MLRQPAGRLNITMFGASRSTTAKKMSTRVLGSMLAARFNAFQQNVDNGVGQAGEMVISLKFAVVKDPCGDNFVDGPEEAVRGDGNGKLLAEHARILAFFEHALDEVKILDHHVV